MTNQIYCVDMSGTGLSTWDEENLPESFEWMAYWYEYACWEGSGYAVIKIGDDQYLTHSLGHCSCYGPMDYIDTNETEQITLDSLINELCGLENCILFNHTESCDGRQDYALLKKVCRLEGISITQLKKDRK